MYAKHTQMFTRGLCKTERKVEVAEKKEEVGRKDSKQSYSVLVSVCGLCFSPQPYFNCLTSTCTHRS